MSKPRRERRIAHEWRERTYHEHERVSTHDSRKGPRVVTVRCTDPNCRKDGKNR